MKTSDCSSLKKPKGADFFLEKICPLFCKQRPLLLAGHSVTIPVSPHISWSMYVTRDILLTIGVLCTVFCITPGTSRNVVRRFIVPTSGSIGSVTGERFPELPPGDSLGGSGNHKQR